MFNDVCILYQAELQAELVFSTNYSHTGTVTQPLNNILDIFGNFPHSTPSGNHRDTHTKNDALLHMRGESLTLHSQLLQIIRMW